MVASIFSARNFSNKSGESIARFVRLSHQFWAAYETGAPPSGDGLIIVDLTETYVSILHVNLLIAKYLQSHLGRGKLVGVIAGTRFSPEDMDRVKAIAGAFGVADFFDIDDEREGDASFRERAHEETALPLMQTDNPVATLLALSHPRHAFLGSSIYATLVRWLRTDALNEHPAEMRGGIVQSSLQVDRLRRRFENETIIASVQSHTHYIVNSTLAMLTIERGGSAYYQHPGKHIFILKFSDAESLFRCRPADFTPWFNSDFVPALEFDRDFGAFERELTKRVHASRHDIDPPSGDLTDAEGSMPAIMIYAHALVDNVHGWGHYIYRDFADWLHASLEIASETPNVTFYVKPHPSDAHYDARGYLGRLREHFAAAANIVFLRGDHSGYTPQSLIAGVTVQGAPGVEMAARGLRMICLSEGRFGDLGFAYVPRSVAQYREWLSTPASIKPMTARELRNASAMAFYETVAGRSRSWFCPGLRYEDDASYFDRCSEALLSCVLGEDPLYHDLRVMIVEDRGFIVNRAWRDCVR